MDLMFYEVRLFACLLVPLFDAHVYIIYSNNGDIHIEKDRAMRSDQDEIRVGKSLLLLALLSSSLFTGLDTSIVPGLEYISTSISRT